jgi:cell shape-determining protein MreD
VIRRVAALAGVIALALLLQTTLLSPLRILGARPDLLLLAVVAVAMASGPVEGAAFGFAAGLTADLLLDLSGFSWSFVGRSALTVALYNLLLTPLVYPLVRRLAERVRAERVVHW